MRDRSLRGWVYAGLRVLSITWTDCNETKAATPGPVNPALVDLINGIITGSRSGTVGAG